MDHVAYLSRKNCPLPILENIAFLTGEMHDSGKLLPEFRQYMYEIELYGEKAPRRHIDHSSVGAKLLEELIQESFLAKLVGTAIYSSWITGLYQFGIGKDSLRKADAKTGRL